MRTAIQATHVILNTAITPGISLIPSSLVILKEPIEGYNNILLMANNNMNFGLNKEVNRVKREVRKPEPKSKESVPKVKPKTIPKKPTIPKSKSEPDLNKITEESEKPTENKVNPILLFIPGIFIGVLFPYINE